MVCSSCQSGWPISEMLSALVLEMASPCCLATLLLQRPGGWTSAGVGFFNLCCHTMWEDAVPWMWKLSTTSTEYRTHWEVPQSESNWEEQRGWNCSKLRGKRQMQVGHNPSELLIQNPLKHLGETVDFPQKLKIANISFPLCAFNKH